MKQLPNVRRQANKITKCLILGGVEGFEGKDKTEVLTFFAEGKSGSGTSLSDMLYILFMKYTSKNRLMH